MSDSISREMREAVAKRAGGVCEYCLMSEEDGYFRFQIEHIVSRKHGGASELENLAFACVFCNRHKGSDIASLSPDGKQLVPLYNPRIDRWSEHFRLEGVLVKPLTPGGEATVRILKINHDDQVLERITLHRQGRYPNEAARLLIMEH